MPSRCVEQVVALARQLDPARRAVEEAVAELGLELADQHTQARGREEERLRRASEAQVLGDEVEGSELPRGEIHYQESLINRREFNACP